MYLGEFVATIGLLLPILSPWSLAIFVAWVVLQLIRVVREELALAAAFPHEYAAYRKTTWRVFPGLC